MKKFVTLVLIIVTIFSFAACASEDDKIIAAEMSEKIENIGEITLSKETLITKIQNEFDILTKKQQRLVDNKDILIEAQQTLKDLQQEKDIKDIKYVKDAIANIGEVSLTSGSIIQTARTRYDSLRDDLKTQITTYETLVNAESKISELRIENANNLIAAVKSSGLENSSDIEAANDAYSQLTNDEKGKIVGYDNFKKIYNEYKLLKEEEAAQKKKEEVRNSIRISRLWCSAPDSAGGVSLYINFTNKSTKTIKYLNFGVTFYNSVGDVVLPDYSNQRINYCTDTGPFATGQGRSGSNWYWGKFYDSTISSVELVYLQIDYMDGTSKLFSAEELKYVEY